MKKKNNWIRPILDLIAPRTCAICGRRLAVSEEVFCISCEMTLSTSDLEERSTDNYMTWKMWGRLPVVRCASLYDYNPREAASHTIMQLKYYKRPNIGIYLGRVLAHKLQERDFFRGIDAIVPVPLAKNREQERGYNQAELIARGVSFVTGLPIIANAVKREKFKKSQTLLTSEERQENVDHLFTLIHPEFIRGKHLLIVDDVMTTGATCIALGNMLLQACNVRLSIATLASVESK